MTSLALSPSDALYLAEGVEGVSTVVPAEVPRLLRAQRGCDALFVLAAKKVQG